MISDIILQMAELEARVLKANTATERDLAEAQELAARYVDELELLEEAATVKPYLSAEDVAHKIMEYWHGN